MYINNGDIDLTNFLDVYIITNGRESHEYVIESLKRQKKVCFNFIVFRDLSLINACNICNDCSNSPYYIRLDDDMILHPLALYYFYATIKNIQSDNAIVHFCRLWEPWNERVCGAVKVYNRKLTKEIGFELDNCGKIDKLFKKKSIEKNYDYHRIGGKTNIVAIHSACSYDDNLRYSKLRNEIKKRN